jgi:hypothetical protein
MKKDGRLNLDYAIKFDPFLELREEFHPLYFHVTAETLNLFKLKERKDTIDGIIGASSVILANLLKAREIDPDLYVSIPLNPNAYTKSRYTNNQLSYRPVKRVLNYLSRVNEDAEIELHSGFFDRRKGGQSRWTRIRANPSFSALLKRFQREIPFITSCPASAPMRQIGHIEQGRVSGSS